MNNSNVLPATINNDTIATIQEKIRNMNVSSLITSIQQVPVPANGHVAICQTEVVVNNQKTSMCAFATPETSQSDEVHVLLTDALSSSMHMAITTVERIANSVHPAIAQSYAPQENLFDAPPRPAYKGRHNPNKPISEGQVRFIEALAQKQSCIANDVAQSVCAKTLSNCSSADADKVIKYLQGKV